MARVDEVVPRLDWCVWELVNDIEHLYLTFTFLTESVGCMAQRSPIQCVVIVRAQIISKSEHWAAIHSAMIPLCMVGVDLRICKGDRSAATSTSLSWAWNNSDLCIVLTANCTRSVGDGSRRLHIDMTRICMIYLNNATFVQTIRCNICILDQLWSLVLTICLSGIVDFHRRGIICVEFLEMQHIDLIRIVGDVFGWVRFFIRLEQLRFLLHLLLLLLFKEIW